MSHHRLRVVQVVMKEANRVYRLFCQRNPKFKGKCSIVAHSLGAPLAIDVIGSSIQHVTLLNYLTDPFGATDMGTPSS